MRIAALAVSFSLVLSGCQTFQRQAAVDPLTIIEAKLEYCSGLDKRDYTAEQQSIYRPICYNEIAADGADDNGRDHLYNLMMVADRVCATELRALSANQRTISAAMSTASTALSATATVVTGGLADNILAAGSTLFGSTRDHINAEVFRGAQSEAITLLIQADRQAIANSLIGEGTESRQYTLQEAIYEANRYHQSCSLYNGLALLTEAAGEKAAKLNPKDVGEGEAVDPAALPSGAPAPAPTATPPPSS